jgi:urease accessory protein
MNTSALLTGLRFVDSFFPTGAYAFSSGLEAAVQHGAVRDAADLAAYVEDVLMHVTGHREAVAVAKAWTAQVKGVPADARATDLELEALMLCREVRMASRQMGRQIIKIAGSQLEGAPVLQEFRSLVDQGLTPAHCAVCWGVTFGAIWWSREGAVAAYLYQTAVGFVSAAMKLLPVGQRESQQILQRWIPWIAQTARSVEPETPLHGWSPVQDVYAMRHARLHSRMFRS